MPDSFAQKGLLSAANDQEQGSVRLDTRQRTFNSQRSELRTERREYNGKKFTALHVWEVGPHGVFPTRKVVTVRDSELLAVIAALQESHRLSVEEKRLAGANGEPEDKPDWLQRFDQKRDRQQWRGGGEP